MRAEQHQDQKAGLYWRRWHRPGGRPVLALHCSLSHGGEWSGLAGSRPDLDIAAPDLVGHGRQPAWDGVTDLHGGSTGIARDLAGRLAGGGPVDVIGHSFGGTVALRLALESPQLIRRLVLVEPVLFAAARGSAVWADYMAEHDRLEAVHARGDDIATARLFLSVWGAGEGFESLVPNLRDYMIARMGLVMALDRDLNGGGYGLLAPGRLEALTRPVLLVEGGDSPAVVGAINAELARRLPQARRVTIAGAGHMVPVTHGRELARVVGDFLE